MLADLTQALEERDAYSGGHTLRVTELATVLARRPHYDLAEFWGWSGLPAPTSPRDANQHGTFYPAHRALRPVFVLMVDGSRVPRLASPAALGILARHGVPTRA